MAMESRSTPHRGLAALALSVSPASYALAVVALLAATLFVVMDRGQDAHPEGLLATAFTSNGVQTLDARALLPDETQSWMPKAVGAYAFALILIGLGFRRKPLASAGDGLDQLLATIPFGVACWSSDGRLQSCNAQYRARLNADPADSRVGAVYSASIRRLIQGGYMQLVSEDNRSRILELHREDGSCLIMD